MGNLYNYKKWCWDNNYYVSAFPYEADKQKGSKNVIVVVEVYNHINRNGKFGIQTMQQGKAKFSQATFKERQKLQQEIDRVYELIYNRYNE
jgi:hypothetical protein